MYQFQDPNGRIAADAIIAPSDNLTVNGQRLDAVVPGYRHLYVDGRGLIAQENDSDKVPGRAGVALKGRQYAARKITVYYQIRVGSSRELRDSYAALNKALSGNLTLSFADEPLWEYEAILADVSEGPEQSLDVKGHFTLLCPSPWKYLQKQASSNGQIRLSHASEVTPLKLAVITSKVSDRVEIINRGQRIVLGGSFASGQLVTVEYKPDEISITYGGRSILHQLQRFSDLENFTLRDGDTVTAVNATIQTIEWRDKRL